MKKYAKGAVALCVLAFVCASFAGAAALDPKSKDSAVRAAANVERLVGPLTQAQQGKVVRIFEDRQDEMRKAKSQESKDAVVEKYNAKIRVVLTPEQQAKFDKTFGKQRSKK